MTCLYVSKEGPHKIRYEQNVTLTARSYTTEKEASERDIFLAWTFCPVWLGNFAGYRCDVSQIARHLEIRKGPEKPLRLCNAAFLHNRPTPYLDRRVTDWYMTLNHGPILRM